MQGAVAEGREFELERALVNALCRLSFMHTAADRQLFVGVLLDAVGDLPDIPGNSRMRMHVLEIVRACLSHPLGLRGLVRALELIAPGQVSTAEVMSLVQSFTVLELLPRAERQRVQELLGGQPSCVQPHQTASFPAGGGEAGRFRPVRAAPISGWRYRCSPRSATGCQASSTSSYRRGTYWIADYRVIRWIAG